MSTPILFISASKDGHMGVSAPTNRKVYFAKAGINGKKVVDIVVNHGNKVKVVKTKDGGKYFEGYDAIVTKEKDLFLGLTCADCMPIALFNQSNNSVGLVHCGWRGLENGVIKNAVNKIGKDLLVFIGPHICAKHYRINLAKLAKKQLTNLGIPGKNIQIDSRCTYEDKKLFSYRRGDIKNRNLYLFTLPS